MDTTSNFAKKLDALIESSGSYGTESQVKLLTPELPARAAVEVAFIDANARKEVARIQALGEALRSPAVVKDPELAKKILAALGVEV